MKGFALSLISKARVFETEKWLPRTQTSVSRCAQRKEGRRKRASPLVFHLSLILCAFRALLFCAKNETPEKEAGEITCLVIA